VSRLAGPGVRESTAYLQFSGEVFDGQHRPPPYFFIWRDLADVLGPLPTPGVLTKHLVGAATYPLLRVLVLGLQRAVFVGYVLHIRGTFRFASKLRIYAVSHLHHQLFVTVQLP
jgi:hypothetical protein